MPACLTGSVLAWKVQIDHWLNPQLFLAPSTDGRTLDEAGLRAAIRSQVPSARIAWIDLPSEAGHSAIATVGNWPDARAPERRVNEVFLDPSTGAIIGTRSTQTPDFRREELVHWIRRFHYTLGFKRAGMVFMGGVAIAWLLDALLGTVLTFPAGIDRWRGWVRAWKVRSAWLNYDLHRASALWLWPALIVLALTSIYLNLTREVFVPAVEGMARALPESWREPAVTTVLEWQEPLHTGSAFGMAGRTLVCITGLAASLGIVTGLLSWLRRLRRSS